MKSFEFIDDITKDELEQIEEITRKCHELDFMPPPVSTWNFNVYDRDRRHRLRYRKLSKSWVKNKWNHYRNQILAPDTGFQRRLRDLQPPVDRIGYGTGDTEEFFDCNSLVDEIGGLTHLDIERDGGGYNSDTKTWTDVRTQITNNNSGNDVTINEVGMWERLPPSPFLSHFMVREKLDTGILLLDGGTIETSISMSMTFPE